MIENEDLNVLRDKGVFSWKNVPCVNSISGSSGVELRISNLRISILSRDAGGRVKGNQRAELEIVPSSLITSHCK